MSLTRGCCILLMLGCLWACSPPRGVYHVVQPGQTLYQISRSYEVEESYLARINGISDPTKLAVGQRVFIPGASSQRRVPATVSTSRPSAQSRPAPKKLKKTAKPVTNKPVARPQVKTATTPAKQRPKAVADTGKTETRKQSKAPVRKKGTFLWPARGRIVKNFGGKGKKASNGVEIAVRKGTAVTSAAAGKVIYSGNGISGYGNLIILQHDDSFYSVYGFNSRNLVDAGGFVSKGQKIALSGVPPSGGTPRLYFEVRYGKRPVNPIFYLP